MLLLLLLLLLALLVLLVLLVLVLLLLLLLLLLLTPRPLLQVRETKWDYGPLACYTYPMQQLDSCYMQEGKDEGKLSVLGICVEYERLDMMDHNVIKRLVNDKWISFGRDYYRNLVLGHILYAVCIMINVFMRPTDYCLDFLGEGPHCHCALYGTKAARTDAKYQCNKKPEERDTDFVCPAYATENGALFDGSYYAHRHRMEKEPASFFKEQLGQCDGGKCGQTTADHTCHPGNSFTPETMETIGTYWIGYEVLMFGEGGMYDLTRRLFQLLPAVGALIFGYMEARDMYWEGPRQYLGIGVRFDSGILENWIELIQIVTTLLASLCYLTGSSRLILDETALTTLVRTMLSLLLLLLMLPLLSPLLLPLRLLPLTSLLPAQSAMLSWLMLIYCLRISKSLGRLIIIIEQIGRDVVAQYLSLMGLLTLMFATPLAVQYGHGRHSKAAMSNLYQKGMDRLDGLDISGTNASDEMKATVEALKVMMFKEQDDNSDNSVLPFARKPVETGLGFPIPGFIFTMFNVFLSVIGDTQDFDFIASMDPEVTMVVYMIFMVLSTMIMLNLIIAMMSEKYVVLNEKADLWVRIYKAEFLLKLENRRRKVWRKFVRTKHGPEAGEYEVAKRTVGGNEVTVAHLLQIEQKNGQPSKQEDHIFSENQTMSGFMKRAAAAGATAALAHAELAAKASASVAMGAQQRHNRCAAESAAAAAAATAADTALSAFRSARFSSKYASRFSSCCFWLCPANRHPTARRKHRFTRSTMATRRTRCPAAKRRT